MKKLIVFIMLLFITSYAFAGSYVVIDKQTKEIKSLSPRQDCVIQKGWEEISIPLKFGAIQLQYHPTYYKWLNNTFILNKPKLDAETMARQVYEEQLKEEQIVQDYMRDMAIDALKSKGKIFKHISKKDIE